MVANSAITRIGSVASQIILAYLLSKEDFGVYALAVSIVSFTNTLRDGGVENYIISKGVKAFHSLASDLFWVSLAFNAACALLLAAGGHIGSFIYTEPRLVPMLYITGLSVLLNTPCSVLSAKLSIDMRFRDIAYINSARAMMRYAGWVLCAFLGYGPLSFVIPLPFVSLIDSIWTYLIVEQKPWLTRPKLGRSAKMLKETGWVMTSNLAGVLFQNGDYLMLGLVMTKGLLGVYFFSYELVAQVGVLFANNVTKVLFPTLMKQNINREDIKDTVFESIDLLMLVTTLLSITIAVAIKPLSELLGWTTRFPGIEQCVWGLAFFFPLRMLTAITRSLLMSRGAFRGLLMAFLGKGVGLTVVTYVSAIMLIDIGDVATAIGGYIGLVSLVVLLVIVRSIDISLRPIAISIIIPWVMAVSLGLVVLSLDKFLCRTSVIYGEKWALVPRIGLISVFFAGSYYAVHRLFRINYREFTFVDNKI